ncbi:MAG: winged helix-turn-helix transcriptional regulator [Methanococci archaeon]|uniref:Phosphate uptake regulator, PhoU n=1 Tax=Methanocaldococcus vulcanius (strain ATCC 700851 / DSM 12094 / M7) TaxID=579137 RepID=C9RGS4_METVM|nr:phosphate uptake regulator PhoU [Methanocaldococcus vulcanius]ACX72776.1 phosphate uptake regulator, PhoU [Methanocaldococcus vulcanius M7]NPA62287.1 winged helix-turn-helix transcriptional regulator [Methanococci archaeon]
MLRGKEATLAGIIRVIIEEEPETQDEIAEKLGISRRYVAKLLKPLIDKGVVKHPYVVDMNKLHTINLEFDENMLMKEIKTTFERMKSTLLTNLDLVHRALKNNDEKLAEDIIIKDYALNKMEEEIRLLLGMDALKYLPGAYANAFATIASNLERLGDYVANIAEEVVHGLKLDKNIEKDVEEIFSLLKEMLIEAIDVVNSKRKETKIYDLEEKLHEKLESLLNKVLESKREELNFYVQFGMFLKDIERFGDRCVNIVDIALELYHNIPRSPIPERLKRGTL